jgi:hypothetical protein
MRDFRDAKAMAHALRDALKGRSVETTHSECLELIAKAFGCESWNVLAAKIEAAAPRAVAEPGSLPDPAPPKTLYCSFCGKSQHHVQKLIAGPGVYICDECVAICTNVVGGQDQFVAVLSLLADAEKSGSDAHAAALALLRGKSTEDVASYVERGRQIAEHHRLLMDCIRRKLAMRPDERPAEDDILASLRFAHLRLMSRSELLALQQETRRALKRYEDALRIGAAVLGERGREGHA